MKKLNKHEGQNFTAAHLGQWEDLHEYVFQHPRFSKITPGKVFLKDPLNLTAMEISINKFPAGATMPFLHRHTEHEEVYIFVRGKGQFQVDNDVIDVKEGTVIRVSPDGARCWRNNSSEDLYCIVIQAKAGSLEGDTIADGKGVKQPIVWPE